MYVFLLSSAYLLFPNESLALQVFGGANRKARLARRTVRRCSRGSLGDFWCIDHGRNYVGNIYVLSMHGNTPL